VLVKHEDVVEAAIVPSPDPLRLSVPKAFITLRQGVEPSRDKAGEIFAFARERLAALQAYPAHRVPRTAQDHLPEDPARRIAQAGSGPRRTGTCGQCRIPRRRVRQLSVAPSFPRRREPILNVIRPHGMTTERNIR
jgi:acetyl-CoA synthetase